MNRIRGIVHKKEFKHFLGYLFIAVLAIPYILIFLNSFKLGSVSPWLWFIILILYLSLFIAWKLVGYVLIASLLVLTICNLMDICSLVWLIIKSYIKMRKYRKKRKFK